MAKAKDNTSQRVETGIRIRLNGYEAYVIVRGMFRGKRFKLDTPIAVIRSWRRATREQLQARWEARRRQPTVPVIPRAESGYCYLYAAQAGAMIKFGRSTDPETRVQELQVNQPLPVSLLVAVPCHHSLEGAVHRHFAADRINGEWFHATTAVMEFVCKLQLGQNPVALLWESFVTVVPTATRGRRPKRTPKWLEQAPTV